MISTIAQIGIILCSGTAAWFVGYKDARRRRWAYIAGLSGQPFWLWSAIEANQWGVTVMCAFYSFTWARGLWNHWVRKEAPPTVAETMQAVEALDFLTLGQCESTSPKTGKRCTGAAMHGGTMHCGPGRIDGSIIVYDDKWLFEGAKK